MANYVCMYDLSIKNTRKLFRFTKNIKSTKRAHKIIKKNTNKVKKDWPFLDKTV